MNIIPNFRMHSFSRLIWISEGIERQYNGKIAHFSEKFKELIYLSVVHNLRQVALVDVIDSKLPEKFREFAYLGLVAIPLVVTPKASSAHKVPSAWTFNRSEQQVARCVVAKSPEVLAEFINSYDAGNDNECGKLLGYPQCCRDFFDVVWQQGYFDPVWQFAQNTSNSSVCSESRNCLEIELHNGLPYSNPLLRYIDIRLCPHIPHSADCEESLQIGALWSDLGDSLGYADIISFAKEMLSSPMEWSVLHGIGEIRTSHFKIATASIPTPEKWIVKIKGTHHPEDVASGTVFPYNIPVRSIKDKR